MAHDVFISYSHKNVAIADAVCHYFEEAGVRCWYAPRDIEPGAEWAAAIIDALESARVMVLIFTDHSNASVQVRREVDTAITAGVTILPFKCTATTPTGSMKYYLSSLHWLDAVDVPQEKAIKELLRVTQAVLNPKKKKSVLPLALAGGGAVVALAAALALGTGKSGAEPATTAMATEAAIETTAAAEPSTTVAPNPAAGGASGTSTKAAPEYVFDADNDSPGAENYLYSDGSTNYYDKAIRLDCFFGEPQATMTLPELIDGLPITDIYDKCFEDQETVRELVLPDTLEVIRYRCFYGCSNLATINMPAHLRVLESWAFAHTALAELTLPETVTWVGEYCFAGCESLKTVVLPEGLEKLQAQTFYNCSSLESVVIPAGCTTIDISAFDGATQATIIGDAGSYAETYAKAKGMNFQAR